MPNTTRITWCTVGIDPGLKGGIAALDSTGALALFDMPTLEIKTKKAKGKGVVDCAGAIDLLGRLCAPAILDGAQVFAALEEVAAMPGQGVSSMFSFGRALGVVETALCAVGMPYTPIRPNLWKKALRVPAAKDGAVRRADQLFPAFASAWRGPRGGLIDGRAEAALLAYWVAQQRGFL